MRRIERLQARAGQAAIRFEKTRHPRHEDRQKHLQQLARMADAQLVISRQRFWQYARIAIPNFPIGGQHCQWLDSEAVFVHIAEV